jgi:hypothetical protein
MPLEAGGFSLAARGYDPTAMRYVVTVGDDNGILPGSYLELAIAIDAAKRISGLLGTDLTPAQQIEVRVWETSTNRGDGIRLERIVARYRGGERLR